MLNELTSGETMDALDIEAAFQDRKILCPTKGRVPVSECIACPHLKGFDLQGDVPRAICWDGLTTFYVEAEDEATAT